MTDREATESYWHDAYCVDCCTKLNPKNGARRPLAENVYQLVCIDCLLKGTDG